MTAEPKQAWEGSTTFHSPQASPAYDKEVLRTWAPSQHELGAEGQREPSTVGYEGRGRWSGHGTGSTQAMSPGPAAPQFLTEQYLDHQLPQSGPLLLSLQSSMAPPTPYEQYLDHQLPQSGPLLLSLQSSKAPPAPYGDPSRIAAPIRAVIGSSSSPKPIW
eukprot:gene1309-32659_t